MLRRSRSSALPLLLTMTVLYDGTAAVLSPMASAVNDGSAL